MNSVLFARIFTFPKRLAFSCMHNECPISAICISAICCKYNVNTILTLHIGNYEFYNNIFAPKNIFRNEISSVPGEVEYAN